MITKLRQNYGETLVETLSALAIVVLAMFLLSNMLLAASRQNIKSTSISESYQQEVAIIEGGNEFLEDALIKNFFEDYGENLSLESTNSNIPGTVTISMSQADPELSESLTNPPNTLGPFTTNVYFSGSSNGKLTGYDPDVSEGGGN